MRRRSIREPRSTAFEEPRPEPVFNPQAIRCPLCSSYDVRRVAHLTNAIVCCCHRCSAEFTISPGRETR